MARFTITTIFFIVIYQLSYLINERFGANAELITDAWAFAVIMATLFKIEDLIKRGKNG